MGTFQETQVNIKQELDIVTVRQAGRMMARQIGFKLVDETRITTAISEVARNIVIYAESGTIYVRTISANGQNGIEVLASDEGPGIENIELALRDGYSTSQGLGAGLPGVRRLMDEFEIKSTIGVGTQVLVRKWLR